MNTDLQTHTQTHTHTHQLLPSPVVKSAALVAHVGRLLPIGLRGAGGVGGSVGAGVGLAGPVLLLSQCQAHRGMGLALAAPLHHLAYLRER